jgi:hypothetical protein
MFEWLLRNKEWIFSGIGISCITGLIALIRRWRSTMKGPPATEGYRQQSPSTQEEAASRKPRRVASLPSGNEIAIAVDSAPPFQRKQIGNSYVGLEVSWPITFFRLIVLSKQRCAVTLCYGDETWGAKITVRVNIRDYPRLKAAVEPSISDKSKHLYGWIEGTIVSIDFGGMEIQPTKLDFFN